LKKCQDGDHLKFGEAFYFIIHPPFGTKKTLFNQLHALFHSKVGNFSHMFSRNEVVFLGKKISFMWRKVDICFEMVQFGTMVPKKKG